MDGCILYIYIYKRGFSYEINNETLIDLYYMWDLINLTNQNLILVNILSNKILQDKVSILFIEKKMYNVIMA